MTMRSKHCTTVAVALALVSFPVLASLTSPPREALATCQVQCTSFNCSYFLANPNDPQPSCYYFDPAQEDNFYTPSGDPKLSPKDAGSMIDSGLAYNCIPDCTADPYVEQTVSKCAQDKFLGQVKKFVCVATSGGGT